jgi:hypothetical protein
MLSLWTGTLHLWKLLAARPIKREDGDGGLLLKQNDCRKALTRFGMAASAEHIGDRTNKWHGFLLEECDLEILKAICVQKFRAAFKKSQPSLKILG